MRLDKRSGGRADNDPGSYLVGKSDESQSSRDPQSATHKYIKKVEGRIFSLAGDWIRLTKLKMKIPRIPRHGGIGGFFVIEKRSIFIRLYEF